MDQIDLSAVISQLRLELERIDQAIVLLSGVALARTPERRGRSKRAASRRASAVPLRKDAVFHTTSSGHLDN